MAYGACGELKGRPGDEIWRGADLAYGGVWVVAVGGAGFGLLVQRVGVAFAWDLHDRQARPSSVRVGPCTAVSSAWRSCCLLVIYVCEKDVFKNCWHERLAGQFCRSSFCMFLSTSLNIFAKKMGGKSGGMGGWRWSFGMFFDHVIEYICEREMFKKVLAWGAGWQVWDVDFWHIFEHVIEYLCEKYMLKK